MKFSFFLFKTFITRMFSLVLFLGCASFVTYRGYECFQKYLAKPEAIDVAIKSSRSQVAFFPSISFCSFQPLKENILKGCNLTSKDYRDNNVWVGKGHANCTDPKVLSDQINFGLSDLKLEISNFTVATYEQSDLPTMFPNDSRLYWTSRTLHESMTCHTMTLPKDIVELGIDMLLIFFKPWASLTILWHEDGLLYSDIPDSSPDIDINGTGYYIPVRHETLDLLDYDGEICKDSNDYKLDKCRYEFIEKVYI
jgi:hypothetical protein